MIPGVTRKTRIDRLISYLLAPLIGTVFRQGGLRRFPFFQTLRLSAFHGAIVGVRLFVVLGARAAKEEQNRLSVSAHAPSFRIWYLVVKRNILSQEGSVPPRDSHA
jgi:hypothetical protein